MTSVPVPYAKGQGSSGRGRRLKYAALLLLLLGVGSVGYVAYQYFQTGKPIADIAPLPEPVVELIQEPPTYIDSLWDVARPIGVAATPEGAIYVTESGGDRMIRAFDPAGLPEPALAPLATKSLRSLAYVAVSPAGKVYVTDIGNRTVHVFSANGEPAGTVASPFAEGWIPEAIAFGRDGKLYLTEFTPGQHRVLVLDAEGNLLRQFGKEGAGPGEFSFPNGIAADAKGNIYVADSGNGRVQAFDREGNLLFAIGRGTAKGDLALPRGIAIDDGRNLMLVVDTTDHNVKFYDISGSTPKYVYAIGAAGTGAGAFNFPNGIALDGRNRIYITDRENHRVTVWRY